MGYCSKFFIVALLSAPLILTAQTDDFKYNFDGGDEELLGKFVYYDADGEEVKWQSIEEDGTISTSTSFRANGSVINSASADSGIWLPVTIEEGHIYTLSADVDFVTGANWISLGYAALNENVGFYHTFGYGTAIVNDNRVTVFPGVNISGVSGKNENVDTDFQKLKIVLDTRDNDAANWTTEFYRNDVSFSDTAGDLVGPLKVQSGDNFSAIQYVGFTKIGNAVGTIKNFTFHAAPVPEASQSCLIVAVIVSLGMCSHRRYESTS